MSCGVVIDVNVWISGSLWGGTPDDVLRLAYEQQITSYVSTELMCELDTTLKKAKFKSRLSRQNLTVKGLVALANAISKSVEITKIEVPHLRDPKDIKILATAIAAQAQAIITGDLDLLVLQSIQGIAIFNPTQFLKWEKRTER